MEASNAKQSTKLMKVGKNKKASIYVLSTLLILISIVISIVADIKYLKYHPEYYPVANILAKILGQALLAALISFLIWKLILKSKKYLFILCFSALSLVIAFYHFGIMIREYQVAKETVKSLSTAIKELSSGKQVEQREFNKKTYGEMAPAMKLLNDYIIQIQNLYSSMFKEIEQQGIKSILSNETMKSPLLLKKAQDSLSKINTILDKYEFLFNSSMKRIENKLKNLEIPYDIKRSILVGYNKTKENGRNGLLMFFNIEKSFVSEATSFLNFLLNKQGKYWFVQEQILFASQDDVDIYNKYISVINRLVYEEDIWLKKTQQEGLRLIKELEDIIK